MSEDVAKIIRATLYNMTSFIQMHCMAWISTPFDPKLNDMECGGCEHHKRWSNTGILAEIFPVGSVNHGRMWDN